MTAFLASVMSAAEAELAVQGGADIIDLKNPNDGALGALPTSTIRDSVTQVSGRRWTSATIGDLPMDPGQVAEAAERVGGLGVNIVKVGLYPGGDLQGCLEALGERASRGLRIVAVLFADLNPDFEAIETLAALGFMGVMLDTATKDGGGLRNCLNEPTLGRFIHRARARGLFTGLAGSLAAKDVAPLLRLAPDYLGFRGALTAGGRNSALDPAAVSDLRRLIPVSDPGYGPSSAKSATAVAGAQ